MPGPGDAVGAEHAFAHRAQFLHRRLAARVASIDAELDPANAAIEDPGKHHVLDSAVEARAAQMRTVISAADFEHLASFVDSEQARHAGELASVEQDEGPV